jgi:hypothetical protein
MTKDKQWGIRIGKWWVMDKKDKPMKYKTKREAEAEASDFNSMRPKGDNPYEVKEYK